MNIAFSLKALFGRLIRLKRRGLTVKGKVNEARLVIERADYFNLGKEKN